MAIYCAYLRDRTLVDLWHAVILALVQGLTEFLPISSSAHLILLPAVAGWDDQGLAFDVAVHVGTLTAVVSYFRVELAHMAGDWLHSRDRRRGHRRFAARLGRAVGHGAGGAGRAAFP